MLRKFLRTLKYYFLSLLRMKNSDHQIAIGFSSGFFPCWYPTFGIDILIAMAFSRMVRGNMAAAVIAASIGQLLWPLLFFINYKIGVLVSHLFSSPTPIKLQDVIHIPVPDRKYSVLADYFSKLGDMGLNFLIGSIVNSLISSVVVYFIFRLLLCYYRKPLLLKIKRTSKRKRTQVEQIKDEEASC
ncbi:DUF2062 domain-containing protein [Paenibacillus sp. N3/727]|uniref:DUF2062 domain-containing protein n=1 Tax=Paenibacillus sp. N3/727 TaxID=2925845 RepID=UPI001F53AC2E|nr:DUF2062 domain-containing protein [Paenibacillus sp. N3/727]UNK17361.1 DUF2062 domain-containing protein [Paenibacillus sp. N3/727]